MRKGNYSLPKRLLAMLLSAVMVLSLFPAVSVPARAEEQPTMGILKAEADTPTLDSWKNIFSSTNVSTEHVGGVWTDKSVLTQSNLSALGAISDLTVGENNFMVALSALAANSVIVGQGSKPTDTVFVLDVSGSMSNTELRSMVSATNNAIHTLLSGDGNKNRVGIVLYSTTATTLLPLDHYTPVVDGGTTEYIELSQGNNTSIRTARAEVSVQVESTKPDWWPDWMPWYGDSQTETQTVYIKDGNGNDVNTSVRTTGGTYIQGGLWKALDVFSDATINDARTPVLVLMSDGAPTYTTNHFNNVPDSSNYGGGNSSTDADGFVTQLTAAYVKEQLKSRYNSSAYLYTLGLGVDDVTDSDVAKEVLDPSGNIQLAIESLWSDYEKLALLQDKTMTVNLGDSNTDPSITYDATVSGKSAYVDRYFSASQASDLAVAFQNIVNEISLQAGYYVTHLDGENANLGGYITFIDEIGSGMQIKEIEGILVGNTLYTGRVLAAALNNGAFGTKEEPTALGDNMVWALKERLGLTDTSVAHDLLEQAWAAGQLSYNEQTGEFSNYIGWFSDVNGDYVGFWDAENPNASVPARAVYANKCYGLLGSTTNEQTNHASDMMYVVIQVSKAIVNGKILDKTPEQMMFRVPAALLPMVTYQIKLNGNSVDTSTQATVTYKGASPIRLLYEVGVHEKMNPVNIHEFMRENYQAKDADGNYYLYSNAWRWENADNDWTQHPTKDSAVLRDTGKNSITYAYFEPGQDNEHYYFTENKQIYTKNGSTYTALTAAPTSAAGEYYYKHNVFTASGTGISSRYEQLSRDAVQAAMDAGKPYVPEGTMHHYEQTHSHDVDKTNQTLTDSFFAVRHHLVDAKINASTLTEHDYELVYMGNNGRITYAPAQGIAISKEMADGSTPDTTFTFDVSIANYGTISSYATLYVAADGTQTTGTVSLNAGKLSVQVKPGDTVYILNVPTDATYEITEQYSNNYLVSDSTGATGTVVADKVITAVFVNRVRGVGSLSVYKTVEYKNGAVKNAESDNKKFPVTVTFTDGGVLLDATIKVDGVDVTPVNGQVMFDIVDGQTVTITGIPEGYAYKVEEGTVLPDGYAYDSGTNLEGVITTALQEAALKNTYTPDEVVINQQAPYIHIDVNKTLSGNSASQHDFEFKLMQFDGTAWNDVYINGQPAKVTVPIVGTGTDAKELLIDGLSFTEAGEYDFRIVEVIPTPQEAGMVYDRTFHDFEVVVTDANLDGKLEISDVRAVGEHTIITNTEDRFNITAGFVNVCRYDSVKLTIHAEKILSDRPISEAGSVRLPLSDGQFGFVLTQYVDSSYTQVKSSTTEYNGIAGDIIFPAVLFEETGNYYFTIREIQQVRNGYTYDQSFFRIRVNVVAVGHTLVVNYVEVLKSTDGGTTFSSLGGLKPANGILNHDGLTFNNIYKAEAVTHSLEGTKYVTNMTPGMVGQNIQMNEDGLFSFTLVAKDGTNFAVGTAANFQYVSGLKLTSQKNGQLRGTSLYFDKAGTYVFKLTEDAVNAAKNPGVSKDAGVYEITIVVSDNGTGALEVTSVAYTKDGVPTGSIHFNNTYKAAVSEPVKFGGTKTLSGIRNIKDGEFSFVLKRNNVEIETVSNTGNSFTFSELTYDTVGTYVYTISELHGGETINGVKYDPKVYTVTVTVTDNGSGKLQTQVTGLEGVEFVNEYDTTIAHVTLTGRKVLAGRPAAYPLLPNEFEFTLVGEGINETKANDANGYVTFSTMTYDTPGTYVYTLSEVIPAEEDKIPGITYDKNVYTVTVTVTDDGKGQLSASVSIPGQNVADVHFRFFNRYSAAATEAVVLGGTKELVGRPLALQNEEFSFVLKDAAGNEIETVSNIGNSFAFTGITFDTVGVYRYTIAEVYGGQKISGIDYDAKVYDVTVTVTDEGTGVLQASVEYSLEGTPAAVKFTNVYAAAETTPVVLSGTKNLVGRPDPYPMRDGEFSFTLAGPNIKDGSETVPNVGDEFTFSELVFTEAGDYHYTVTEVKGGETHDGILYDKKVYNITIKVTDNNVGKLEAEIIYTDGAVAFTNVYDAADTDEVILSADKVLTGRPEQYPLTDKEFSFNLKGENVDETVENLNGKATFSGLTFSEVGIYTYTITEIKGDLDYISYDEAVYTVTIEVTDDGTGKLKASVIYTKGSTTVEADEVIFTNIYDAKDSDPLELGGTKDMADITGGEEVAVNPDDGDFSFNLKGHGTDETVKLVDGAFKFSGLTFGKADTYTYTITEVNGGQLIEGVNYDKAVYTVTVTVIDDGSGKLKVESVTYSKDGTAVDEIVFSNTYKAEPVTDVVIEATKELTDITGGGKLDLIPVDGDFSFVLKQGDEEIETVTNIGNKVSFPGLTFEKPGVYNYTISEVKGAAAGFTYDEAVYNVTVTVTDDEKGQLEAKVEYDQAPVFSNTFKGENAKLTLSGKKTLTGGRDLKEGEFSFVLKNSAGEEVQTVTNAASGLFTFDTIEFDTVGEYTFTLVEIVGDDELVTYDETVYEILVTVTYDGKEMKAVATVSGEEVPEYGFTNIFTPVPAEVTITVEKNLDKKTETEMGLDGFTFQLVNGENVLTAVSGIDGLASFDLKFYGSDAGKTFTYKLSEVNGGLNGVTYDEMVYEITVTVTQDPETGALTATVSKQDHAVFTNTYKAEPVTDVVIEATKELTDITGGGKLDIIPVDGAFTFVLKQGDEEIETVTNIGSKVSFSGLTFEKPGVYNYTISEVKGAAAGFAYDETVYNVTITVTDNATGQLQVEVEYDQAPVFNNTFKGADALLSLCGKKTLAGGRDLKDGEFSFVLKNSAGEEVQTVTNAADGTFVFDILAFDTVGTYNYTLVEVAGDDEKVTYDETVYEILVTVTYDGKEMKAVATVSGEEVSEYGFTNIFTPDVASVIITAEKKLEKKTQTDMGVDGFTFQLSDGENALTAVSGIDGLASFELKFGASDVGKTFTYTLSEVKGDVEGITYDETVYEITVTVTQDAETGALTATVSKLDNAVFTNVYEVKPVEDPDVDNPQTGDQMTLVTWTAILTVTAFSMMAVLVVGKKKLFG